MKFGRLGFHLRRRPGGLRTSDPGTKLKLAYSRAHFASSALLRTPTRALIVRLLLALVLLIFMFLRFH